MKGLSFVGKSMIIYKLFHTLKNNSSLKFNPFATMGPTGGSHFAFHILISKCVLLKNGIYHQMQREKFYNPHSKAYFNCIIFVFRESKTLCDSFSRWEKIIFFSTNVKFHFSYLIFLSPNMIP